MKKTKTPFWKCALSTVILWVSVLVGGTLLVYIINALNFMGSYAPGSVGFYIIGLFGGPAGVWLGQEAMEALTEASSYVFRGVNFVVVAAFCGCFILFGAMSGGLSLYNVLLSLTTGFTAIIYAVAEFKRYAKYLEGANGQNT